jgi:hypothetical protein
MPTINCDNLQEFLGKPTIQFAENNLAGCIAQPANTYSNLAFIIVGIWCWVLLSKTKFKDLYLFPISFILIGLTSGFYHASATFFGQFLDFFSIYILGSDLIYLAAQNLVYNKTILGIWLCVFTIILGFILWFAPIFRIPIAFAELFALIYLERKNLGKATDAKPFKIALLIFILSFAIWNLDLYSVWDIESLNHIINGHAIWHILNSFSLYFVFRYYLERETKLTKNQKFPS